MRASRERGQDAFLHLIRNILLRVLSPILVTFRLMHSCNWPFVNGSERYKLWFSAFLVLETYSFFVSSNDPMPGVFLSAIYFWLCNSAFSNVFSRSGRSLCFKSKSPRLNRLKQRAQVSSAETLSPWVFTSIRWLSLAVFFFFWLNQKSSTSVVFWKVLQ